jgi:hypothetical protein
MRVFVIFSMLLGLVTIASGMELGNKCPQKSDDHVLRNPVSDRQGGENIANAVPIGSLPYYDSGATCDNVDDYDEVCNYPNSTSPDVVYSFYAATNQRVNLDLCGSGYDTKLYVYDSAGNVIDCNDDYYAPDDPCGDYVSYLRNLELIGGQTYYIVIDGYGGDCGSYVFLMEASANACLVECQDSDVLEGEPPMVPNYVDMYNGGCNSPPDYPFQDLGAVNGRLEFCGVTGWFDYEGEPYRDTDWFTVVLGPSGYLEARVYSEIDLNLFELGPQDCATVEVLQSENGGPCDPSGTLRIVGTPGDLVWIWVGPSYWATEPAAHSYRLIIDEPVSMYTLPGGTGNSFSEAQLFGGSPVDVSIEIEGLPRDVPYYDFCLETTLGGLVPCPMYGACADHGSGGIGRITFANAPAGGGTTDESAGERARVLYIGEPLPLATYNIQFNSPDINGDGIVNLSDLSYFASDYFDLQYKYRSDFYWDGWVNLTDIPLMAMGLSSNCPQQPSQAVPPVAGMIGISFGAHGVRNLLDVKPGIELEARITVRELDIEDVITGWEYRIENSENLVVDGWDLPEQTVNVLQPPQFAVGCARGLDLKSTGSVKLMSFRFHVTDTQPAWLRITCADPDGSSQPLIAIGKESNDLYTLAIEPTSAGPGFAFINSKPEIAEPTLALALELNLHNAPNPFNPTTDIHFNLPVAGNVTIEIHDLVGRRVRSLAAGSLTAGPQIVNWSGTDRQGKPVASGVYFYRLMLDDEPFGPTGKAVMLK